MQRRKFLKILGATTAVAGTASTAKARLLEDKKPRGVRTLVHTVIGTRDGDELYPLYPVIDTWDDYEGIVLARLVPDKVWLTDRFVTEAGVPDGLVLARVGHTGRDASLYRVLYGVHLDSFQKAVRYRQRGARVQT